MLAIKSTYNLMKMNMWLAICRVWMEEGQQESIPLASPCGVICWVISAVGLNNTSVESAVASLFFGVP